MNVQEILSKCTKTGKRKLRRVRKMVNLSPLQYRELVNIVENHMEREFCTCTSDKPLFALGRWTFPNEKCLWCRSKNILESLTGADYSMVRETAATGRIFKNLKSLDLGS